jgi:ATPase subunit of ABC transporter with duplicated ATPase domains
VLFVTHDRYFLNRIATRIIEIDDARIYSHPGNYSDYLESKALRESIEANTERRRQSLPAPRTRIRACWRESPAQQGAHAAGRI